MKQWLIVKYQTINQQLIIKKLNKMQFKIKKAYNTETSKKVCSYVVNDWTHELYQSKAVEYFTYIYKYDHYMGEVRLVSENEVSHMMERSGLVSGDKGVTVLNGLKDWCDEENKDLKVTGEDGLVNFDFGSWDRIREEYLNERFGGC